MGLVVGFLGLELHELLLLDFLVRAARRSRFVLNFDIVLNLLALQNLQNNLLTLPVGLLLL